MPRKPRFFLPDVPVHIVQRGHSRGPAFFESQDYATYAYWLKEASARYEVRVHAFVLMTNHIHLLATASEGSDLSACMQYVGLRYVPYINHKYGRSGTLWEGRFKASLIQAERYFLAVMRYIELNPVRAGMVKSPAHYHWSSFCHNVGKREISFIQPHMIYSRLGRTTEERVESYKALFRERLEDDTMKQITDAWLSGTPLGNVKFKQQVEEQLVRKVGQVRRGRPRKIGAQGGKKCRKKALTP